MSTGLNTPWVAYRINGELCSAADFYAVACDPSRSVAVEACAGAGKTWMLVSRMLRALLEGCEPQHILAITFTKKAAAEMRGRLQGLLRELAVQSDAELVQALCQRGLSEERAQQQIGPLRGLQARLAAHGRPLQIRTFHSWFASLLRSAPLSVLQQLGLPLNYELLEDDSRLLPVLWPRFYGALAAEPTLRADFEDSVRQHGRSQTTKALEAALQKRVEFALLDGAGGMGEALQEWTALAPELAAFDGPLVGALELPTWRERLLLAAQRLGAASAKTQVQAGRDLEQAVTDGRWAAAEKALLTAKQEDRVFSERLPGLDDVRAAQALLRLALAAERQRQAVLHQARMVRLSRCLLRSYADLKRRLGWVDMSDVELAARHVLGDVALSGWVQQRLDAQLRQVLIDEFQDTNPLQWHSLYGWLQSYSGAGSGVAPSVFLVGDPKQSIYRFRRAEPKVFKEAQRFVVQGLGGVVLSCDHTRRCAPAVLTLLNRVMAEAQAAGDYGSDFRPHSSDSTAEGAVWRLAPVARASGEVARALTVGGGGGLGWRDSLTHPRQEPEERLAALEAEQAADWVAERLRTEPGLRAQDIMVLSRKRERLGWLHAALQRRGIASEQPEKTELSALPVVRDVLALLDALVSPRHSLSLAQALKSPLFGWSDHDLVALAALCRTGAEPDGAPTQEAGEGAGAAADAAPAHQAAGLAWWDGLQAWAVAPDGSPLRRRLLAAWAAQDALAPLAQGAVQTETLNETPAERSARWLRCVADLTLYRAWLHSLPPHDALAAVYAHGQVLVRFAEAAPMGEQVAVLGHLRELLQQTLLLDGGRYLTPYRLVRLLKAGGIAAAAAPKPGAVRLLTIHGAKGLEAHTVLLLDTDGAAPRAPSMGVLLDWPGHAERPLRLVFLASEKNPPPDVANLLQSEREARALEELNTLYVAITRAERRLVISSSQPARAASAASWWQRLAPHADPLALGEPPSPSPFPAATALAAQTPTETPAASPGERTFEVFVPWSVKGEGISQPGPSQSDACLPVAKTKLSPVLEGLPVLPPLRFSGASPLEWPLGADADSDAGVALPAAQKAPSNSSAIGAVAGPTETAPSGAPTQVGLALHRLLQWHPTQQLAWDWSATHLAAVAREFQLDTAQAQRALAMARRVVAGPAAWVWDPRQVVAWANEVDLQHRGQTLRLDRWVQRRDSGRWWVIDFKSGLHPERVAEHQDQLRRYGQAATAAMASPGATLAQPPVGLAFINGEGAWIEWVPDATYTKRPK